MRQKALDNTIGSALYIAQTSPSDAAARRGCDKLAMIRDRIRELRAQDRCPVEIWVNGQTANDMRALYASFALFDGVLPETLDRVPIKEGSTGGHDVVFLDKNGKET